MVLRAFVMPVSSEARRVFQVVLALAVALLFLAAARVSVQAAETHTLVIPPNDGYGFEDCLGEGKNCGRIIADAWCEAHGLAASIAYGRAEDVTGATPAAQPAKFEPGSFIVTCGE